MAEVDGEVVRGGPPGIPGGDAVMREAKKRFKWCTEWESTCRPKFVEDCKFAVGDSDNGYQWPNDIRANRDVDSRPCLTMNLVRQHNKNISNEARKNKASPKVVGTGNGATEDSARVFRDLIRHVEVVSNAQTAYTIARGWQIDGGIGWWRIVTDYADWNTFDQEAYVRPVNDPLSVYMDPDIQQIDGSDARFAFVFDNVPRDEFDESYPEFADMLLGQNPMGVGSGDQDWISRRSVRVCEYFRKTKVRDLVVSFMHQGVRKTLLASQMPENVLQAVLGQPLTKTRETFSERVEWFLIVGEKVVDATIWPGKFIPLVRVIGEESVIEGILDRKGHTRYMKDAQRMYNYNASAQVEFVALQGKTPWVAAAQAIEEYETMWNSANVVNHSVLVYNAFDDDGNPLPVPTRTQPPAASPGYQLGMETAFNQVMMVSGQWQNQMGMMGNERTGRAIDLRQQQSATAVYHFHDNYEVGLRFTATLLIDLLPIIYDTRRVISILAEDGTTYDLEIDPTAREAYQTRQLENGEIVRRIFNPSVGKYWVAPAVGPAYGTKREEAREALGLILTQNKELAGVIGDLLLEDMDFEGAKEAARRLKRLVPPQALGVGPTQNEQVLQSQVANLQAALVEALQENAKIELKLAGRMQLRNIDAYKADTDRLAALKDYLVADPEGLRQLVRDALRDAQQGDLSPIIEANENNLDIDPVSRVAGKAPGGAPLGMPPGAKQGPDGKWYVETSPGQFAEVEPK